MRADRIRPKHIGHVWSPDPGIQPGILSVARSICEAGYFGRYEGAEWTLDYSFTPFGRYRAGAETGAWKERPALEAHLYPPRTPYWEDTGRAGVAQTRGIFVSFTGGELALHPSLTRPRYVRLLDPGQRLGHRLERLLEIGLTLGAAGFADAQVVFWEIIALLNSSTIRDRETRILPAEEAPPAVSGFLHSVRAYLHEHLAERVTREGLAHHLKVSVSALAHRYHHETGEALMATRTRMRIHVAKSLLMKGCPLKLIAGQTGFYDEFHLSRTFKRIEGVSARDFRRQQMRRMGPARLLL